MKRYFIIILLLNILTSGYSQTIVKPNYGLKSHETLNIDKVEITRDKTTVNLTIENRIENGSFCADRNIYIITPDGTRLKLLKSSGIPRCPESYKFSKPGEKLSFSLVFPTLGTEPPYVDIKEECSDNCFSFYGVVLDEYINSRLDEAFSMAERGESVKAMNKFIGIDSVTAKKNGIRALVYYNIVKLANETGNTVTAGEWYKKLYSMRSAGGKIYIEQLNLNGIKF